MKGNGLMVNLKAKELSIILMGFNFRDNGIMDKKMESGLSNIQINRPTREILQIILNKVKGNLNGMMERYIKENLRRIK